MNKRIYTLGLDVGIASVGWAVVENVLDEDQKQIVPYRLLDTGVRVFDVAENPKDGSSLAEDRRLARSVRRTLRRRKKRVNTIKQLLIDAGLVTDQTDLSFPHPDPYELRTKALDEKLPNDHLAKAILHLAKRRGFQSNRKNIDLGADKDGGEYKSSIEENKQILEKAEYRTVGEMFYRDTKFKTGKRNTDGSYRAMVTRAMLKDELSTILHTQKQLGNSHVTDEFIAAVLTAFSFQRPFASEDQILKMVGTCTLETETKELRSPRHAYSYELFSLLSKIANTKLYDKQIRKSYAIDNQYKEKIQQRAKEKQKLTYSDLRKILSLPDHVVFDRMKYRYLNKEGKDPEKESFFELKGYHQFKKALKQEPEVWRLLNENTELLDVLAEALTYYRTDDKIVEYLKEKNMPADIIAIVKGIPTLSGVGHLSLKAVTKLLPHLYTMGYHDACTTVYGGTRKTSREKKQRLPVIDQKDVRQPVVLRSLTQTRRVVNAIIRRYGLPAFVHIELAREMKKPYQERKKLEKHMLQNQQEKQKLIDQLKELGIAEPDSTLQLKYRLWKQQNHRCAYSLRNIGFEDLRASNRTQIDHILPFSRSLNDSFTNKVVVFTEENQKKKNMTPIEYFEHVYGARSEHLERFKAWVESIKTELGFKKRENLLNSDLPKNKLDDFIERDMNDTRYIARFMKNYIEDNLQMADLPEEWGEKKRRVFTFPGFFTAKMRNVYGIGKERADTNRHHAMDAIIVAASNSSMLKIVADFYQRKELQKGIKDNESKFIQPWPSFRTDAMTRVYGDDLEKIDADENLSERYVDIRGNIRPLFVSRAVSAKVSGPAHKDTYYTAKHLKDGFYLKRLHLTSLKEKDLDAIYGVSDELRRLIAEYVAAGRSDDLIYNNIPVRKVKVVQPEKAGALIHDDTAFVENGSMVRTDIYKKEGKYYMNPVYVADVQRKKTERRAVVAGKKERDWPVITDEYEYCFSLAPGEYVKATTARGLEREGYYYKSNRFHNKISVISHDDVKRDKDTYVEISIGGLKKIIKRPIGILGY